MGYGISTLYPIYTELTECRDCYKCVRACPVKSIQVRDARAVVIRNRCISCGRCVDTCPSHAKKIRNDVHKAQELLIKRKRVIVSLAPSYASEYGTQSATIIQALKKLGFYGVSETAIGAALVSSAIDSHIAEYGSCSWISTACPSVVELIQRYYPTVKKLLSPIPSPLQCHSAYLRHLYGQDIGIVFIGPCIAKKVEADQTPGYPDVALTFRELNEWLADTPWYSQIQKDETPISLIPALAGESSLYAVEGGMVASLGIGKDVFQDKAVSVSGVDQVMETLDELEKNLASGSYDGPFLELLSCEGGCICGPGRSQDRSAATRKAETSRFTRNRIHDNQQLFSIPKDYVQHMLSSGYSLVQKDQQQLLAQEEPTDILGKQFSEEDISRALHELGKHSSKDELNCGGCGYNSCRDMAVAYLEGMAEPEMCVTKMRKLAQSKIDVLLRTIPMGVVIVDSNLTIMDCNSEFLTLFGDMDKEFGEYAVDRISGLPLQKFVPFSKEFSYQFTNEYKIRQTRVQYKGKFLKVTFFIVENHHLVGAIFEDITTPTVRRETVVKKADAVIQKSLETVQQIASLLGENAAETEIMLNSLIEAFQVPTSEKQDGTFIDDDIRDL